MQARAIGGDFYDMQDMPDGQFGFLVGDVAGKGPAAALLTSKILGIFSAFVSVGDEPVQTVDHINKVLTRRAIDARYATLFYGQLSADGQLRFCNAGHNPPLVYGVDGLRRLESGGMPVGLFEFGAVLRRPDQLKPGDIDGALQRRRHRGAERRRRGVRRGAAGRGDRSATAASSADVILEQIIDAVKDFAHGAEQYDDVTALVVKYLDPRPDT